MLIHGPTTTIAAAPNLYFRRASSLVFRRVSCINKSIIINISSSSSKCNSSSILKSIKSSFVAVAAAALVASSLSSAAAGAEAPPEAETLENIPQLLSGECVLPNDCKKPRIQKPKSRKAESCTIKCVTTCIRGGEGSPGEGPFNVRRPLVVFKEGFRSRRYCLVECSDICNLMGEEDDGP
ncbi:hypothetical protein CsatB_022868 [Cannabis sativa]|uniref:uncharacterized protein LOC115713036 n=1 Tax=Cannabis sativa TaxID=3483 RepID=UPI0011E040E8|nr:uncharacterized protein LOC115713036 [Cannabis sativa]